MCDSEWVARKDVRGGEVAVGKLAECFQMAFD